MENFGGGRLKAGDRAPDAELRDEKGRARRLFELFHEPRHVLLLFLGALDSAAANFDETQSAFCGLPDGIIDSYRIVRGQSELAAELRDTSGLAHAAYGLIEGGVVLVRPDGYVGYRSNNFDLENLRTYLARIFTHTSRAEAPVL